MRNITYRSYIPNVTNIKIKVDIINDEIRSRIMKATRIRKIIQIDSNRPVIILVSLICIFCM